MELHGSRGEKGVKVKFIETQFVSSDTASFKSVVQRLTGKPAAPANLHRPRPCRAGDNASAGQCASTNAMAAQRVRAADAVTAQVGTGARAPPCLEELHELCDFSDLFYVTAGDWRDGSKDFPY